MNLGIGSIRNLSKSVASGKSSAFIWKHKGIIGGAAALMGIYGIGKSIQTSIDQVNTYKRRNDQQR